MKISFDLPQDMASHLFCIDCSKETVRARRDAQGNLQLYCHTCNKTSSRCIFLGKSKYWLDKDTTLWHESGGFFVRRPDGKFLFFERDSWPFGLNIPCGHVDFGETGEQGALRELREEVGMTPDSYRLIDEFDFAGDKCSAGADDHHWSLYLANLDNAQDVSIKEEGRNLRWLTLDEALALDLVPAMRALVERYRHQLQAQ